MIYLAREAGTQEDHTVWGSHLAPDTPQLVLAVRRHGSREQLRNLRLLGRATARRLPDLRVSLACVDRGAPALTDLMASATSESVVVPLWLVAEAITSVRAGASRPTHASDTRRPGSRRATARPSSRRLHACSREP